MNYKIKEFRIHSNLKNKIIFVKGYTINSTMPATIYNMEGIQFYNASCGQKKMNGRGPGMGNVLT